MLHVVCSVVVVREDFAGHPGAVLKPRDHIASQRLDEIIHRKAHRLLFLNILGQRLPLGGRACQLQQVDFRSNLLEDFKVTCNCIVIAPLDAHSALG